jgi:BRCA1-associated protein
MPSYFFHLLFELYTPKSPYCRNLTDLSALSGQQLVSLPAWIPPPNTDIFATALPSHPRQSASDISQLKPRHIRQKSKSKEKESAANRHPDWRFGRVKVESIDMAPTTKPISAPGALSAGSTSPLTAGAAASKARFIPLETRNTEFGYGVVHLYRDSHETPGLYDPPPELKEEEEVVLDGEKLSEEALTTVAILAVPSYMTPSDFMGFVGEGTRDAVSHLRMVRTGKANRYMVLMKFRDKNGARKFVNEFNGKVFNSMEVCDRIVRTASRCMANGPTARELPCSLRKVDTIHFAISGGCISAPTTRRLSRTLE